MAVVGYLDGYVDENNREYGLTDTVAQGSITAIKDGSSIDSFGDVETALADKVDNSKIGSANGIAGLDANGRVPSSQLPSYVDDVLEYASQSAFPATGETGKIYIALDTNKTYRWSGSAYVEISESLALGETSSTAYAGNKGKANADAISAMKDGSSIDSFGDVETALAGKADKFGVDGSTIDWLEGIGIPDKLYVIDHDEIPQENEWISGLPNDEAVRKAVVSAYDLMEDTVGWTGKNLLGYKVGKSYNASGVMVDSTHGVISAIIPVSVGDKFIASKKTAISSSDSNMMARQFDSNGTFVSSVKVLDKADLSGVYTVPSGIAYVGFVQFYNDGTISQSIVDTYEMMLRKATILDDTYEPYRGTTAFPRDEQAVLGAVNQWPTLASGYTYTQGGVTFTWLEDGSIDVDGTSTSEIVYIYETANPGLQRLRGNWVAKSLGSDSISGMNLWLYKSTSSSWNLTAVNTEIAINFTDAEHASGKVTIYIAPNRTFNHVVVKPVLYPATVPSDTPYIPFAMTNEQLTEVAGVVSNLDMSKGISSSGAYTDLNDVKTSGIYAVFGSALNKPADVSTIINGTLIVTHKTSLDDVTQTLINGNEGTIYVRTYATATGWSSWYKFTGTVVS